jgi:hypothetical protein
MFSRILEVNYSLKIPSHTTQEVHIKKYLRNPTALFLFASDAARVCMQSNLQPVLFTKYLLQLRNVQGPVV